MANAVELTKQVKTAMERELNVSKSAVSYFSDLLKPFEKKYKMSTNRFVSRFEQGKLGDSKEMFDWVILSDFKKDWEKTYLDIKSCLDA